MLQCGKSSLDGKSLVLTGAGGFLGRHLLPLMLGRGLHVSAVTSRSREELCLLADVDVASETLTVVSQNDRVGISETLNGADFLINAGFPRGNDGRLLARGMDFIDWLFREASVRRTRAVINVSSQSVYDQHRTEPATEETPVCPQSTYAVAKYATELMLSASCRDVPHTNIRLASLIGAGFNQRIINKLIFKALNGETLLAIEGGSQFGYLDVRDAAEAIVELCETANNADWEEVYNVGTANGVSITDMIETIADVIKNIYIRKVPAQITEESTNTTRVCSLLDSSRFSKVTAWRQGHPLEDTVGEIIKSSLSPARQ